MKELTLEEKVLKLTEVVRLITITMSVSGLPETNAKMLLNILNEIDPFLESPFDVNESR